MAWSFNGHTPVYLQIAERLRNEIIRGKYKAGQQIPPVRQLAVSAAVNPNTMQRAFVELEAQGLICAKGTQGRFVTEDEEILVAARQTAARQLVSDFLRSAEYMSLSPDELIEMIKEESDNGNFGM